MNARRFAAMVAFTILSCRSIALGAETLESFLIDQALGKADLDTYHDEARALILSKDRYASLGKKQIEEMLKLQRNMQDNLHARTKVLEFRILSKYETTDAISVVSKIKIATQVIEGVEPTVTEHISHDILLKKNGLFFSVFSVGRDDSLVELARAVPKGPGPMGDDYIPRVDGTWKIVGAKFPGISAMGENKARAYFGRKVEKSKGYFGSPFITYNYCGLEQSYKRYPIKDFLKEHPDLQILSIPGTVIAVNTFRCANQPISEVQFITVDDNKTAYMLWDGVYFVLNRQ